MNLETITKAKSFGFSDKQIANLAGKSEQEIREFRRQNDLLPSYRLVDTCAAEFEAYTPYYYSSYDRGDDEIRASETRKVMILGGGPNRIGDTTGYLLVPSQWLLWAIMLAALAFYRLDRQQHDANLKTIGVRDGSRD